MAKILAPNKEYTGLSASVFFVNGVGETDNQQLIEWFKERGYKIENTENLEELKESEKPKKKK